MCIRDRLYLFTSINKDICEEGDSTQACELHARNSIQNHSVFLPSPSLLKYSTLVHKNINYKCDVCTKTFTHAKNLSQHKLIHSGVKKYQCDVCTKTFTHSGSLAQHKLIHSGTKKYQCDVCTKSFTQPNGCLLYTSRCV